MYTTHNLLPASHAAFDSYTSFQIRLTARGSWHAYMWHVITVRSLNPKETRMKSGNTNKPSDSGTGKQTNQGKEKAPVPVSRSGAKPSSSRSADQGEKKTTGGK